jgi:hypothetical protein
MRSPKREDARRQTLERDAFACQMDPPDQRLVVREHLERRFVGDADVLRVAGERRPAERSAPFTEQRPDVLGDEAGNVERVGDARLARLRPDVVAVVERNRAALLQREQGAHMVGHRRHRPCDVVVRIPIAQPVRFVEAEAVRHVAIQRIVRRRLIGDDVRRDAARHERRQDVRRVGAQAD